eukprot:s3109_g6.t1
MPLIGCALTLLGWSLRPSMSSKWEVVLSWFWKRPGYINVLELGSTVSLMVFLSEEVSSVRFASLIDSAVCSGALSKGRHPLCAGAPKTRGRSAKHQAARIDQSDIVASLSSMYRDASSRYKHLDLVCSNPEEEILLLAECV